MCISTDELETTKQKKLKSDFNSSSLKNSKKGGIMYNVEISFDGGNWFQCGCYFFYKNAVSHKKEIETQTSHLEIYVRMI
mgnify:CR=1 FL=1